MFRIRCLAVALAISSGSAIAAADFQGFYGQVGVGYESLSTSTATGNIGLGILGKVSDSFLLGVGTEYSPFAGGNVDGYTTTWNSSIGYGPSGKTTLQKQNSYGVFVIPATPVGEGGLLYGKIGYTSAQFSSKSKYTNVTAHGYLLGVGYKHQINNGLYGFLEGNYSNYGDLYANQSMPAYGQVVYINSKYQGVSSYNLMAGIGYKF